MKRAAARLLWSLVVVWTVVSVVFALNDWLPGDPARMVTGPQARPADVARIRAELGLDRPPIVRYARFWRRLVHLGPSLGDDPRDGAHATCATLVPLGPVSVHVDFGKSFQMRQPVAEVVATRMPRTFALALAGVVAQLGLGLGAGILAAVKRGTWIDRSLSTTVLIGIGAPTFLVALLLQYVFARSLRLLPLDGFGATPGEHLRCIVLPAMTLGIYGAAYYARLIRDEMIVLLRQGWVRTARAKGAGDWRVVVAHALRNALVPVATAVGLDFGALMGGAVVTETVFRWPGLGDLSVRAMLNRDGPVITACVVVTSVAVVTTNLLIDLVCARLDPRLRS